MNLYQHLKRFYSSTNDITPYESCLYLAILWQASQLKTNRISFHYADLMKLAKIKGRKQYTQAMHGLTERGAISLTPGRGMKLPEVDVLMYPTDTQVVYPTDTQPPSIVYPLDTQVMYPLDTQTPIYINNNNTIYSKSDTQPHPLCDFIQLNTIFVKKLPVQLTNEQAEKLEAKHQKELITEIIAAMDNYKPLLKKYTSVYHTITGWIRARRPTPSPSTDRQITATSNVWLG